MVNKNLNAVFKYFKIKVCEYFFKYSEVFKKVSKYQSISMMPIPDYNDMYISYVFISIIIYL